MATLFISHSIGDEAAVRLIVGKVREAGYHGLFLDFDPVDGIAGGRKWEKEVYARLRQADAIVFIASRASLAGAR